MKATKRIFAVVMAVMLLALMIPFSAGAAGGYTANITAKEGYTVSLYKIGALNADGTAYTAVSDVDAAIKAAVEASPVVPQDVLDAAEAAKKGGKNTGSKIGEQVAGATGVVTFNPTDAGLYYATITGTPAGTNVKKTGGSIFYLSDAKIDDNTAMTTATVDISGKIEDGTVNVSKEIVNGDISNTQTTAKVGENVTFKLTASVTGTKDEYLKSYVIHDSMAAGLDFVEVSSVQVDTTTLTVGDDYTVDSADKADIKIALTEAYLNAAKAETDNGFYNAASVTVTLVGKLNASAIHGRTADDDATAYANTVANYNKDSLSYTNKYDAENTKEGNTVHVYTFDVDIYKVDATNNDTKLDGATFTLSNSTDTFTAETKNGGKATFAGLKKGTYTLKETVAPKGYNLNNTEYTVTIGADGTVTSAQYDATLKGVKIGDTPVVMPATGGNGTMIFTIVGASLIACAGILFVILKKRAASK
ncbi:MAG: SpaH/EbpB family LPXTG-anchored major pilin [Ruminococcus sp.]|nr:SpaH/EbpB family LPXTG-anchored major pilin [Ruminococcus sp.]